MCAKAPEERTEQRLKQWYPLTAKIINSNKTGPGAVYTLQGQHSAEAQHWSPATGKPCSDNRRVASRSHHPLHTCLLPLVPRGAEDEDTQNGKINKTAEKNPT